MKITPKVLEEKSFIPYTLTIEVNSQEESEVFHILSYLDCSFPDLIARNAPSDKDKTAIGTKALHFIEKLRNIRDQTEFFD